MPIDLLMKIRTQVDDQDSTYDELVGALSNSSTLTFSAAAEDLCTGERGRVWELEGRKAVAKTKALLGQVTREADTKPDMIECITVALVRDHLVPGLKSYVDSARRFGYEEFISSCEEWERVQPYQTSWFKKTRAPSSGGGRVQGGSMPFGGRKPVTCYTCGKSGHVSRECRSRPQGEAATAPVATAAPAAPPTGTHAKNDIMCFRCKAKRHKSPDCPSKPKGNRRVQMPVKTTQCLLKDELFGHIGKWGIAVTIDTGAQMSIVPSECVEPCQFTGKRQVVETFEGTMVEGDACVVQFKLDHKEFERKAVALAGERIKWRPCIGIPIKPRADMDYILDLAEKTESEGDK